MTIDVKLNVSNDVMVYLQREAERRKVALDTIVSEVLTDYFDDPTHEALLAGLKRSCEQVAAGAYHPSREFLDTLE